MRVQYRYIIPLLFLYSSFIGASASSSASRSETRTPMSSSIDSYTNYQYVSFYQDKRELLSVSKGELLRDVLNTIAYSTYALYNSTWPNGPSTTDSRWDSISEHIPENIRTEIGRIWDFLLQDFKIQPLPLADTIRSFSNLGYFWHRLEQHEREKPELSHQKINDIRESLLNDLMNPTIETILRSVFYRGYIFDVSDNLKDKRLDDIDVHKSTKIIPIKSAPFVRPNILYSPYHYTSPLSEVLGDLRNGCLADIFDVLGLFSISTIIRNRLYRSRELPDNPSIIATRLADHSKGIELLCTQKKTKEVGQNNLFIQMTLERNNKNNNDIRQKLAELIKSSGLTAQSSLPKSKVPKVYTLLIAHTFGAYLKIKMEIKFTKTHDGYDIAFIDLI